MENIEFLLKVYPPLKLRNGEKTRLIKVNSDKVTVGEILEEVLSEINSNSEICYRPEELLVMVEDKVVEREYAIKSGQTVKLMPIAMGG